MDCCSREINTKQSLDTPLTVSLRLVSCSRLVVHVTWQSKMQSCVALSTVKAEYIALSGAAQEAVWLKQLNQDLTGISEPVVIYEDNQSAIAIAKNPQFHGRVKHINLKYHFIREQVNNNNIELKYCQTSEMIADMLTKGLGRIKFEKLRAMAGIVPLKN